VKIEDPALVREFRLMACELCGSRWDVVGHHLLRKGMGGGSQIDHRWNMIALCKQHHDWIHSRGAGGDVRVPTKAQLWQIVAEREKQPAEDLEAVMRCLWRLPRGCRPWEFDRETAGLTPVQREWVVRFMERPGRAR